MCSALVIAVAGCSGSSDEPGPQQDGPQPGEAGSGPLASLGGEPLWHVSSDPTLSIGVLDGAEADQLVDVSDATIRPDGSVVVVDAGAASVRVFDSRGVFMARLGARGEGPGEFRTPRDVVRHRDGSVSVFDEASFRVTTFSAGGELSGVRSFGLDLLMRWVDPPPYPASGWVLANGDVVLRLQEKAKPPASGSYRESGGVLLVSGTGNEGRVVERFQDREQVMVAWDAGGPSMMVPMTPPLGLRAEWAIQPGGSGFCTGDAGSGEVRCSGDAAFARTLVVPAPVGRVPPDHPLVERWRIRETDALSGKVSMEDARRFLDRVPLPDRLPAFVALHVDVDGNLWVERPESTDDGGQIRHMVYGVDGAFRGWVDLPRMRVLEIGRDHVLGVQEDDLEVQYVRRFEFLRPTPG